MRYSKKSLFSIIIGAGSLGWMIYMIFRIWIYTENSSLGEGFLFMLFPPFFLIPFGIFAIILGAISLGEKSDILWLVKTSLIVDMILEFGFFSLVIIGS